MENPYAFMTALSFWVCARRSSDGMVSSSFKSARLQNTSAIAISLRVMEKFLKSPMVPFLIAMCAFPDLAKFK